MVTGSSGIAAEVVCRLAGQDRPGQGRRMFVISRDAESCAQLSTEFPTAVAGGARADLQQEDQAEQAFSDAEDALGRVDGVVAVAGGSARRQGDDWLHEMSLVSWRAALDLNLTTMFLSAREAVRRKRAGGGSLVLTSSVLATSPQPDNFTSLGYAAAKAAIAGWVTPVAAAYAAAGIRFNQ